MSAGLAAAVLAGTVRLVAAHQYAEGAPPGFSGAFGEDSCHACHFQAEPNAGPGRLTLDGVPATYTPGERYTLTITLTRLGMKLGGFQLSARFKDGAGQAGGLAVPPGETARVGVEQAGAIQYAGQRKDGATTDVAGTSRWTVSWTAPATPGIVVIGVAANAADGDGSARGDNVHTTTVETAPRRAEDAEGGAGPLVSWSG
ncbi:MAG: choice-of-anchor V domain-containing protein [Acidobacteriota bacterium]